MERKSTGRTAPNGFGVSDAVEHGQPGSIMCAYNKAQRRVCVRQCLAVNEVLKKEENWRYPCWVHVEGAAVNKRADALGGLGPGVASSMTSHGIVPIPISNAVHNGGSVSRIDEWR